MIRIRYIADAVVGSGFIGNLRAEIAHLHPSVDVLAGISQAVDESAKTGRVVPMSWAR